MWKDEFRDLGLEDTLNCVWDDATCWFGEGNEVRPAERPKSAKLVAAAWDVGSFGWDAACWCFGHNNEVGLGLSSGSALVLGLR